MRRWLTLLALGLAISVLGCPIRRTHDYVFSATGLVIDENGSPLKDAEITLEVNGPVYEALTPVKIAKQVTAPTGGFAFTYLSHERGAKYTITVSKDGFAPQTLSGSPPPAGAHTVHLKRKSGLTG